MAALTAAIASCVFGKPGSGSKSGGVMRNTPSTPENAFVRPAASEIEAIATSQPLSAHGRPLSASRTTALTGSRGRQQSACNNAADLAGDSRHGIHAAVLRHSATKTSPINEEPWPAY